MFYSALNKKAALKAALFYSTRLIIKSAVPHFGQIPHWARHQNHGLLLPYTLRRQRSCRH